MTFFLGLQSPHVRRLLFFVQSVLLIRSCSLLNMLHVHLGLFVCFFFPRFFQSAEGVFFLLLSDWSKRGVACRGSQDDTRSEIL